MGRLVWEVAGDGTRGLGGGGTSQDEGPNSGHSKSTHAFMYMITSTPWTLTCEQAREGDAPGHRRAPFHHPFPSASPGFHQGQILGDDAHLTPEQGIPCSHPHQRQHFGGRAAAACTAGRTGFTCLQLHPEENTAASGVQAGNAALRDGRACVVESVSKSQQCVMRPSPRGCSKAAERGLQFPVSQQYAP